MDTSQQETGQSGGVTGQESRLTLPMGVRDGATLIAVVFGAIGEARWAALAAGIAFVTSQASYIHKNGGFNI